MSLITAIGNCDLSGEIQTVLIMDDGNLND